MCVSVPHVDNENPGREVEDEAARERSGFASLGVLVLTVVSVTASAFYPLVTFFKKETVGVLITENLGVKSTGLTPDPDLGVCFSSE